MIKTESDDILDRKSAINVASINPVNTNILRILYASYQPNIAAPKSRPM
jgi:hypothetical protein